MAASEQEIEVSGHLIDSSILTRIFDVIMDMKGEFEVLDINVGKRKKDSSYARLRITGKSTTHLTKILELVYREGATSRIQKPAALKAAPANRVMPDNFYSTTNAQTSVFYDGRWLAVKNMMMDKCIAIREKAAYCVPVREVEKGDRIIVGDTGVRITPPARPREGLGAFEFMGGSSSSERPTGHVARRVAEDMRLTKRRGGKIVLVAGPAIVHTGAVDSVAGMISGGYIHGLLAGNALAVHDIEHATLGTSLGMNIHDGTLAVRGHRNHMDAVNAVFKAGSIRAMIKSGKLRKGIMYQCVKKKIPYVLAGSIRDDGPLPDVITDVVDAQKEYKKVLKGADMVIMVSTMLHSIATGNMLPADVKVVIVDINQATVTKLMDRGTWQALGIVSDAGAFLPLVAKELKARQGRP